MTSLPINCPEKIIHFIVCAQRDNIGLEGETKTEDDPNYPHYYPEPKLHVPGAAIERLRRSSSGGDPIVDIVFELKKKVQKLIVKDKQDTELYIVSDEDWHSEHHPEFKIWGKHCCRHSEGAKLPQRLEDLKENFYRIRANSINISTSKHYSRVMDKILGYTLPENVKIGVTGVFTDIKVEYLILNLLTANPQFAPQRIAVCSHLTASITETRHRASIEKIKAYTVKICDTTDEYLEWITSD